MIKWKICYFVLLVFFISCKEYKKPKGLLSQKKMEAVFADIMKVEAYTKNFIAKDTQKNAVIENAKMQLQVFALHKITKEDFYQSYDYYMGNVNQIQPIIDSIIAKSGNERTIKSSPTQDPHKILEK